MQINGPQARELVKLISHSGPVQIHGSLGSTILASTRGGRRVRIWTGGRVEEVRRWPRV